MADTLKLTYRELEEIISGDLEERFEVLFNKIPYDSNDPNDDPSNYLEDDGRQLRYFEFKDKTTGEEYSFSYVWHGEDGFEMPYAMLGGLPKGIEIVKESVLYPPKPVVPVVVPKTPEQLADEAVWAPYQALVDAGETRQYAKGMVPEKRIRELRTWLKTEKFNMYGLRAKFIPVCIEYKVEQKSFWQYVQGWSKK
jgi:hypothetical protein